MTLAEMPFGEVVVMDADEAREITNDIRRTGNVMWSQITKAFHGRAWAALGYESWDAYCDAEFDGARLKLPREERTMVVASLADAGMSVPAIATAIGVTERTIQRDRASQGATFVTPCDPDDEIVDAEELFPCGTCGELFSTQVWECDECHHHLAFEHHAEGDCKYCHKQTRTVTGTDGKSYTLKPKPHVDRRPPLTDALDRAGWAIRKDIDRLVALAEDDRFTSHKEKVAPAIGSHLTYAISVCQDVLDRLDITEEQR